ncbi:ATP-binding cassette domain-containing protein [Streptomyces sp. NPDC007929]|uniref:ABC transporter ATP-binding protein n=1 Tax=unclassified Streptomyces TaxID=2593676 RepID=UPI0036E1A372
MVALDRVSVGFGQSQFTAIMGPSGSGKSTLTQRVAGLDSFSSGSVQVGDIELGALTDRQLTKLRRDKVGFIFQVQSAADPHRAREHHAPDGHRRPGAGQEWLDGVIQMVGFSGRLSHRPAQLSGGQQQRVAVARALVSKPDIVFGDEPTGNLDSRAAVEVLGFLRDSVRTLGQTAVDDPRFRTS